MPRPIPLVEPVTRAVLPVRFMRFSRVAAVVRGALCLLLSEGTADRAALVVPPAGSARPATAAHNARRAGRAPSDDAGSVVHADHEEGRGGGDQGDGEDV